MEILDSYLANKILEHEGLAEALLDYFDDEIEFDDADFTEHWHTAREHLLAIRDHLEALQRDGEYDD